jgi:branched-chain amino acid transport system permease protein
MSARAERSLPWAVLVAAVAVPFVIASGYWVTVLTTLLINVILVLGLNFMLGYAGLLNLGYAAFAGVGSYATVLAMQDWGLSFWLALPFGIALSVVVAVLTALPTLRLSKIYLGIVTLALGEIFSLLVLNLTGLTGGAIGLGGIQRPTFLGLSLVTTPAFYCFVLAIAVLLTLLAARWDRSHFGRAFRYVREDEVAAESSGIDTARTKLLAFAIGAAYAAVGGALVATQFQALGPSSFEFATTLLVLTMLAVGGSGSLPGVILGAALLTVLPEISRSFDEYRLATYGLALVAVMLFRPQGLIPARARTRIAPDPSVEPPGPAPANVPAAGEPLAVVRGLTKRFGGLVAVNEVSFDIRAGEILSIIGPNGAGKTTLVDMLCGAQRPTRGSIGYRGEDLRRARPSGRALRGVGRTFQRIRLFGDLTVLDNVMAAARPTARRGLLAAVLRTPAYRRAEAEALAQARACLAFLGEDLASRSGELAKFLPYGLQKRLEVARALAMRPTLLVLDEPAAGLNSGEKAEMAQLMLRIRDAGTTVVLIEHDMALVMGISDRILVLDGGAVLMEGAPAAVQEDERVIDAYLGREVELV